MIKPIETEPDEVVDIEKGEDLSVDTSTPTHLFFGADTPLRRAHEHGGRPYEERPQQLSMAVKIAAVFDAQGHLCVEAPTGVGKTFAYLVPAIHYARQTQRPVVISTHTISLQEQIIDKDLPLLAELTDAPLRFAIAKGRGNYVCLRRLYAASSHEDEFLPSENLKPQLVRIREWAEKSRDGSRSSLEFRPQTDIWDAVCCEMGNCMLGRCRFFKNCFFMNARRRLLRAHVIVANHALFFSDLGMKIEAGAENAGILPRYGAVILDEAHLVEDTAAVHLGVRITNYGIRRALRRLYNPERNRGLLLNDQCREQRQSVVKALESTRSFFRRLQEALARQQDSVVRYQSPGGVHDTLGDDLAETAKQVRSLAKKTENEERCQELLTIAEQIETYRTGIRAVLDMQLEDHVYWFERYGPGRKGVSMNAVPVEVGELLEKHLFSDEFSVIMTSATLAVRGKMDYFCQRTGSRKAEKLILSSPFNFQEQVTLYVPRQMPHPNHSDFIPAACDNIRGFLTRTHGKAFVLFTSYRMMREVATRLESFFLEQGIRLLTQGEGLSRSRMLEAFRDDIDSVIFGTASFWTGVDVPGEALSNVMIVRLPFAVPDHPLVAARQEAIQRDGKNAFFEYALPEAVLKFRQGFGRLIRSRNDRGIVVVLDNRILTARYGKIFLDSIPSCHLEQV